MYNVIKAKLPRFSISLQNVSLEKLSGVKSLLNRDSAHVKQPFHVEQNLSNKVGFSFIKVDISRRISKTGYLYGVLAIRASLPSLNLPLVTVELNNGNLITNLDTV